MTEQDDDMLDLEQLAPRGDQWREHAACKGKPTEWWVPDVAVTIDPRARAICATCPVRDACLADALDANFLVVGLWGGVSVNLDTSGKLRAGLDLPKFRVAGHGTHAAIRRHRAEGTPLCAECALKQKHRNQLVRESRRRVDAALTPEGGVWPSCGTPSGVHAHRSTGTPMCALCVEVDKGRKVAVAQARAAGWSVRGGCGTPLGIAHHRRAGEQLCPACAPVAAARRARVAAGRAERAALAARAYDPVPDPTDVPADSEGGDTDD